MGFENTNNYERGYEHGKMMTLGALYVEFSKRVGYITVDEVLEIIDKYLKGEDNG